MNRGQVRSVADSIGLEVTSGPLGIRCGLWRIYNGGGIAGNSDQWWIDCPGRVDFEPRGPFTTMRALGAALEELEAKT